MRSTKTLRLAAISLQVAVWVVAPFLAWPDYLPVLNTPWLVTFGAFGVAGILLLIRRPDHAIGWLMVTISLGTSLGVVGSILASRLLAGDPVSAAWSDAVGNALMTAGIIGVPAVLVLFPDGVVPEKLGRLVLWFMGLVAAIGASAALLNGGWGGEAGQALAVSPLREATAPLGDVASQVFFMGMAVSMIGASVILIRRWRHSTGMQRQQIKWLALAGALVVVALAGVGFNTSEEWEIVLASAAISSIPVAIVIAVLRYRLYEIDRLISRTVTYALVVSLLGVVFFGLVTIAATFLPSDNPLVVAGATLAVFALFNPLRKRVQTFVDSRFNRARYDAEQVVTRFTASLQEYTDPVLVVEGWLGVVEETMEPERVGVWVRDK